MMSSFSCDFIILSKLDMHCVGISDPLRNYPRYDYRSGPRYSFNFHFLEICGQDFLWRLNSGARIFKNRPLFKNNVLLFSGHFCGGGKAVMEGHKVMIGGSSQSPLIGKTMVVHILFVLNNVFPELVRRIFLELL